MVADGRRKASDGREAAFGSRSAYRQQRRTKARDRGGSVWPPRSNAKDRMAVQKGVSGRLGGSAPQPTPKFFEKKCFFCFVLPMDKVLV